MAETPRFDKKGSLNVTISELVAAPTVSLLAVRATAALLPAEEKGFRKFVAEKLVLPHLVGFEKYGGHVFKAYDVHQEHDFSHLVKATDPELPEKPYKDLSKKERAYKIADILTKTTVGYIAETGAALGTQIWLNKKLGTDVKPYRNVAIDAGMHALTIGAFMTVLAPAAESFKDGLANILEKAGMKREGAKDTARTATYVTAPSVLAYLTTLFFVNRGSGRGH